MHYNLHERITSTAHDDNKLMIIMHGIMTKMMAVSKINDPEIDFLKTIARNVLHKK